MKIRDLFCWLMEQKFGWTDTGILEKESFQIISAPVKYESLQGYENITDYRYSMYQSCDSRHDAETKLSKHIMNHW